MAIRRLRLIPIHVPSTGHRPRHDRMPGAAGEANVSALRGSGAGIGGRPAGSPAAVLAGSRVRDSTDPLSDTHPPARGLERCKSAHRGSWTWYLGLAVLFMVRRRSAVPVTGSSSQTRLPRSGNAAGTQVRTTACRAGTASALPLSAGFLCELLLRDDLTKPGHVTGISSRPWP